MYRAEPTWSAEEDLWARGLRLLAGLDEAGRGAWAGPVVASAVILPRPSPDRLPFLQGLRDSKQLTLRQRERMYAEVCESAIAIGVGQAEAQEIDALGIARATRLAMQRALAQLAPLPDGLLLDYVRLPEVTLPQQSIVHGDALSYSIAAASIIAKVTRDRILRDLDGRLPGYGFARHKGYGTESHSAALQRLGVSDQHRRTFAPVAALLSDQVETSQWPEVGA
ncbi:MAG: ribonuclease HII [Anaerolineae bacterium]|nr:ribonuclease HII [Anaerolineae bacterium]